MSEVHMSLDSSTDDERRLMEAQSVRPEQRTPKRMIVIAVACIGVVVGCGATISKSSLHGTIGPHKSSVEDVIEYYGAPPPSYGHQPPGYGGQPGVSGYSGPPPPFAHGYPPGDGHPPPAGQPPATSYGELAPGYGGQLGAGGAGHSGPPPPFAYGYPPGDGHPPPAGLPPATSYGQQPPGYGGRPGVIGYSWPPPPTAWGYPPGDGHPPPAGLPPATSYGQQPPGYGGQPGVIGYSRPPRNGPPPPPSNGPPAMPTGPAPPQGHGGQPGNGPPTAAVPVWPPVDRPLPPFDVAADCAQIREAMRGVGTNENALIRILANRSNAQRALILAEYKIMFGKDLKNELKSELSGYFETAVLALMEQPRTLYMAKSLRRAMRGVGTDENTLIDILMLLNNSDMEAVKNDYHTYYDRDLEKDCVSETSESFKTVLVRMLQANRDQSDTVDLEMAKKDAEDLFQAGEAKFGTDEKVFVRVLLGRNFQQSRATFTEYQKIAQRDILNSIDRELSGDLQHALKAAVLLIRNPAQYFASRLFKSMKGAGTETGLLIRIVVMRREIDLQTIKQEFLRKYHKTLIKMIEGDTKGDLQKLLVALVGD